jgi:DNA-binding NarL/FixJ family response regulator
VQASVSRAAGVPARRLTGGSPQTIERGPQASDVTVATHSEAAGEILLGGVGGGAMSLQATGSRPPIRVVLADDAYLVREAIKHLLQGVPSIAVVGECGDAGSVVGVIDAQRADLLVTDIRMPPSGADDGIRLAASLRRTHPALGVIVLSTYAEAAYALKLFEDGSDSRGYLLKDRIRDRRQVLEAIRTVADGGFVIDPKIVEDLVVAHRGETASRLNELTPRELETLALVAEGKSNAAIADELVLTKRAVEKHVNAMFAKLELGDPEHVSRRVTAALVYLHDRPEAQHRIAPGG